MASRQGNHSHSSQASLKPADRLNLLLIVGSTREGRLGPEVGRWFAQRLRVRDDIDVRFLDLAVASVPETLTYDPPTTLEPVTRELDAADAFVLVTPEYNHSFPAPLQVGRGRPLGSPGGRVQERPDTHEQSRSEEHCAHDLPAEHPDGGAGSLQSSAEAKPYGP